MLSFTQFLKEQEISIEELLCSDTVLAIIEEYDEEDELSEASFQFDGKTYKTAWGRYSCDGKTISRDDYMDASRKYKNSKKIGYKEKAKQDIKATGEKVQKQSVNIRINVRDAQNKLEELRNSDVRLRRDAGFEGLRDRVIENRDKAASTIKLLKKYHEKPDSLSDQEKKRIDFLYKDMFKGRKNKDKDILNHYMDDYKRYNRIINDAIDKVNKAYKQYKSGADEIDFSEL
jgi:hypothetical protein